MGVRLSIKKTAFRPLFRMANHRFWVKIPPSLKDLHLIWYTESYLFCTNIVTVITDRVEATGRGLPPICMLSSGNRPIWSKCNPIPLCETMPFGHYELHAQYCYTAQQYGTVNVFQSNGRTVSPQRYCDHYAAQNGLALNIKTIGFATKEKQRTKYHSAACPYSATTATFPIYPPVCQFHL